MCNPSADEVLVRVRAASVNIADWYEVTGRPWIGRGSTGLRRPKETQIDTDYAGVVEAVGSGVNAVFGGRTGACAEFVVAKADRASCGSPKA